MNYATIGSFIGHETTHGFDDGGRQLDAHGNFLDWWNPKTLKEFNSRATCFIEKVKILSNSAWKQLNSFNKFFFFCSIHNTITQL